MKPATVVSFNRETGYGRIRFDEGGSVEFHATYFHSGLPARFPMKGDKVQAVYDDTRLVEVRLA